MISVTHNADAVAAALDARPGLEELRRGMQRGMIALARYIGTEKLSGQVLHVRTGTGRRVVVGSAKSVVNGLQVTGSVSNDPSTKYLQYQNDGAHIPEVTGKLMVFPVGVGKGMGGKKIRSGRLRAALGGATYSRNVFTMRHKAFDLPARSFMRSGLEEMRWQIYAELQEALQRWIAGRKAS
jgi:hypothetical protein